MFVASFCILELILSPHVAHLDVHLGAIAVDLVDSTFQCLHSALRADARAVCLEIKAQGVGGMTVTVAQCAKKRILMTIADFERVCQLYIIVTLKLSDCLRHYNYFRLCV